jgi:hypothetical protein
MIKKYLANYEKKEFYGLMGQFFAEPKYKKMMPYLKNKDTYKWFVKIIDNQVVAFTAYELMPAKINFAFDFYQDDIADLKELIELKMVQLKGEKKRIETATADENIYSLLINIGFVEVKETVNYKFLILDNCGEKNDKKAT